MKRAVCLVLAFLGVLCGTVVNPAVAAPAVTYLYPAGAQRGTTAEVVAGGTFDAWPMKVWASGKGVFVAAGKDKGKLSVEVAADATPGVYWLRAYTDDGASALRPFVVGTLPEVAEKEPNDEPAKPQVIDAAAVVVNGQLAKAGDVDCFAVALRKGQTLVASLDAHHTFRSPMDAVLQLVSADGFVVAENHDFRGLDPHLAFTAPADGTYVARVFAFPAMPDTTVRLAGGDAYVYRLTLTTGGFADHALPLAVSRAEPGTVEVVGWNVPAAALKLSVPPSPAGESGIDVNAPGIANPFHVRLEPHPTWNATAAVKRGEPYPPPFSITGRLAKPGATDSYPIAGKKGQALAVQVQGRAFGLPTVPVVRVLDAAGKALARAEPAALMGDVALAFAPPADGTYAVEVGDLFGDGGPRHAYLLRVTTSFPDFTAIVAADRFAVPPGKTLDIPVKVVQLGALKMPVEVVAEGLPAGVTWAVKPPAEKADPNTVTVTLTGGKAGASGPFRLVGRVKGDPTLARPARAPLADFEETTTDLWVTVGDAPATPPPKKK